MSNESSIFLIQGDGELTRASESPYASEDVIQTLLARYPDLLAGDLIDSDHPRRWLLIKREMGVPSRGWASASAWH